MLNFINGKYTPYSSQSILERIIPGLVGMETYFEHIERYRLGSAVACKQSTIVDLACGTGYGSYYIAKQGKKRVIGIDIEKNCIKNATNKYSNRLNNLSFINGNASDIPLPGLYADIFVSFETLEHLENPDQFLNEMYRVLKYRGLLILSSPNKHLSVVESRLNPFHINELYIEEILSNLQTKNFQLIALYGQGIRRQNNEKYSNVRLISLKEKIKYLLPVFIQNILRKKLLLPGRTGIPATVINWYTSAPTKFEDWIAENTIRTNYRPTNIQLSRINTFKNIYNNFIIIARKC
jgi:ubiquinone/menaquinone biosynthesis C-methylase UbiE